MQALARVLHDAPPELAVMSLQVRRFHEFYPAVARSPFLTELTELTTSAAPSARSIRPALLAAPPERRRESLRHHVCANIGRSLRLDPARLDDGASLMSLGLDSLMALEIRNSLETTLELTLPASLLFSQRSIDDLTDNLAARMGLELAVPAPTPVPADDLDDLSTDQLAALLAARLSGLASDTPGRP